LSTLTPLDRRGRLCPLRDRRLATPARASLPAQVEEGASVFDPIDALWDWRLNSALFRRAGRPRAADSPSSIALSGGVARCATACRGITMRVRHRVFSFELQVPAVQGPGSSVGRAED
jgi:hypothetical protein